jgi:hypothetical protein
MNHPAQCPIPQLEISFNSEQMLTLTALRALYQEHHGIFTQRELAHLRFVHWLYRTGKVTDGREDDQKVA